MRALVQRVRAASVAVDGIEVSGIGCGLCVFLGVEDSDGDAEVAFLSAKLARLRIFGDSEGKMNLSVTDAGGSILLVSQFTLYADARKGNRPSFIGAGKPQHAEKLYKKFADALRGMGIEVGTGVFGADMLVHIENDGPVTIWLDTAELMR